MMATTAAASCSAAIKSRAMVLPLARTWRTECPLRYSGASGPCSPCSMARETVTSTSANCLPPPVDRHSAVHRLDTGCERVGVQAEVGSVGERAIAAAEPLLGGRPVADHHSGRLVVSVGDFRHALCGVDKSR